MLHIQGNMVDIDRLCWCLQTLQIYSCSYLILYLLNDAQAYIGTNRSSLDSSNTLFKRDIDLTNEAHYAIQQIHGLHVIDSIFYKFYCAWTTANNSVPLGNGIIRLWGRWQLKNWAWCNIKITFMGGALIPLRLREKPLSLYFRIGCHKWPKLTRNKKTLVYFSSF